MNMWQRIKSIRIHGCIVGASLTGLLLGTTMVLLVIFNFPGFSGSWDISHLVWDEFM